MYHYAEFTKTAEQKSYYHGPLQSGTVEQLAPDKLQRAFIGSMPTMSVLQGCETNYNPSDTEILKAHLGATSHSSYCLWSTWTSTYRGLVDPFIYNSFIDSFIDPAPCLYYCEQRPSYSRKYTRTQGQRQMVSLNRGDEDFLASSRYYILSPESVRMCVCSYTSLFWIQLADCFSPHTFCHISSTHCCPSITRVNRPFRIGVERQAESERQAV